MEDPTVVSNQAYTTQESITLVVPAANGLLRGATDPDGFPIEVITTTSPANGKLTVARNGSLVYSPNLYYNGLDGFDFWAGDGRGAPGKGTVTINIGEDGASTTATSQERGTLEWLDTHKLYLSPCRRKHF